MQHHSLPAGPLHPGTHTLNLAPNGNNNNNTQNNNNVNNNNNNPSNNPNDMEYRVTVKQKKKQTAACDACKRRRRKCSGTQPCAYCTEKRCECNYSQQHKRGKRKANEVNEVPSPDNQALAPVYNISKAHKLWSDVERVGTIDKFCGIRWWWKNLLDIGNIKDASSPAYRAQFSIISAWMSRIARDHTSARHHYDIARHIAVNGFGDSDPVATTTAYLLLADYAPSEKEYNHYSWKYASTIRPGTATERHVYFYAMCYQACVTDELSSYGERLERLLSFGSDALQSSVIDLWDTVFFMSIKSYVAMMSKLERFLSGGPLRTLSNLCLSKPDRDSLMMDLRVGEILMQSQIHMFGFEYQNCIHFTKIMLLWAGGDREKAIQESIRFVQNIEKFGENALFLVEVKNLLMPLMLLNEVGINAYNTTTVNIIETICKETDQPDMLAELLPLFNDLRLGAPSINQPLHQPTYPLGSSLYSSSSSSTPSPPSSSGSPNDSPVIEEVPEHILLENAAAQAFFSQMALPPYAGSPTSSSSSSSPSSSSSSSPLSNGTLASVLANVPLSTPVANTPFSSLLTTNPLSPSRSSHSTPSPPLSSPSPISSPSSPNSPPITNLPPIAHITPSTIVPTPPQRIVSHIPPPRFSARINQPVPGNLHIKHPLSMDITSSVINAPFYSPPSPPPSSAPAPTSAPAPSSTSVPFSSDSSSYSSSPSSTYSSSTPSSSYSSTPTTTPVQSQPQTPLPAGPTNTPLMFPFSPTQVSYDSLNWDNPNNSSNNPPTPSTNFYADLLLSTFSSTSAPSPSPR